MKDSPSPCPAPGTRVVVGSLAAIDPAARERLARRARRVVAETGLSVGVREDGSPVLIEVEPRPLVVPADRWAALEAGLAQRAVLLDAVLRDLYGERRLVERGVVPAAVVAASPYFVPQAVGLPHGAGLLSSGTDVVAAPDGGWLAVADRTRAPQGAGYALGVRRVTTRVLPNQNRTAPLRRLRGFLSEEGRRLRALGPAGTGGSARVALLTQADPSFDEVITASMLGFPMARDYDLAVREGRLLRRTTRGTEPVDVLVRHLDSLHLDPLDATVSTGDGVAGLIEAARTGAVSVVNRVGSGILESPVLPALLPRACRMLLDEELLLPGPRTWWLGDAASRDEVLDRLDELELAPLAEAPAPLVPGGPSHRVVVPAGLDAEGRAELVEELAARPWAWCARERVAPWPVPDSLLPDGPLAPAGGADPVPTGVLRTLTLGGPGERLVMPGGVVVLDPAAGASASEPTRVRDVWVMDAADRPTTPALDRPVRHRPPRSAGAAAGTGPAKGASAAARRPGALPLSRSAAQDLYWFGRYSERGESTARLALVAQDLIEDSSEHPGTDGFVAMSVLLDAIDAVTAVHGEEAGRSLATREGAGPTTPREHLRALVLDAGRRGTVRYSARRAALAAGQVRDLLSEDTWIVLARLEELLAEAEGSPPAGPPSMTRVLGEVLELHLALTGVTADGLVRDASWAYLDAGRRVERAQETLRILRAVAADPRADGASAVIEAVARSRNSVISLRRRIAEDPAGLSGLEVGLDLLLSDPSNPRSVLFQLERLREDLAQMPSLSLDGAIGVPLDALTVLDAGRAASDREHLLAALAELGEGVRAVSAVLDATAFRAQRSHRIVQEVR